MGRWFEELTPGLVIDHAVTRTITEADNTLFSVLTMNAQPLHLDESFAATTEFGTRLVNSLFTLSLLIGLSVFETTLGTTVANLGFEEIAFPAPVIPGDTIHAQTEVVSPGRRRPGPARGSWSSSTGRSISGTNSWPVAVVPPSCPVDRRDHPLAECAVCPGQPPGPGRQGTPL